MEAVATGPEVHTVVHHYRAIHICGLDDERRMGDGADELAVAKEWAEKTAAENAKLYSGEQGRREAAEALAKSSRLLSSLATVGEVPQ